MSVGWRNRARNARACCEVFAVLSEYEVSPERDSVFRAAVWPGVILPEVPYRIFLVCLR